MSKGDGRVVIRKCLVTKFIGRRSSARPLNGPVGMFAEEILSNDPYKAYQKVSW